MSPELGPDGNCSECGCWIDAQGNCPCIEER